MFIAWFSCPPPSLTVGAEPPFPPSSWLSQHHSRGRVIPRDAGTLPKYPPYPSSPLTVRIVSVGPLHCGRAPARRPPAPLRHLSPPLQCPPTPFRAAQVLLADEPGRRLCALSGGPGSRRPARRACSRGASVRRMVVVAGTGGSGVWGACYVMAQGDRVLPRRSLLA